MSGSEAGTNKGGSGDEAAINDANDSPRIKILAIGDEECGKTSLNIAFAKNNFPEDVNHPNVQWEEYNAEVQLEEKLVPVQLWELPSQDCYSEIRTLSYENMDVALLCFSVVNQESFRNVSAKWLPELRKYLPDVPIVLVGTKCDLRFHDELESPDLVSNLEALALCEKIRAFDYVECSAKMGEGVQDVYVAAVDALAAM